MTRCLIIEGDPAQCRKLQRMLEGYGFEIDLSGDTEDALSRCSERMPDIIIVSAGSGGGVDFLRRLRVRASGHRPHVLFCAERAGAGQIGRAIWEGATEWMAKPFDEGVVDLKLRQMGLV